MTRQTRQDPVLITAEIERDRLEAQRNDIADTLAGLAADLRRLQNKLRHGEARKSGEDGKLLSELRYWLKAARDAEAELEDFRRKETGLVGAYALDLDAARHEIGCRLARIRTCCGAGALSE